jgi:hypothetical protein
MLDTWHHAGRSDRSPGTVRRQDTPDSITVCSFGHRSSALAAITDGQGAEPGQIHAKTKLAPTHKPAFPGQLPLSPAAGS